MNHRGPGRRPMAAWRGPGAVTALCGALLLPPAAGKELQRLYVDLDGDSKVEAITLSASAPEPGHPSRISVRIGAAVFSEEHEVLPEGRIEMRAIIIDRQRSQRQLALTVQQPGDCVHHLLAYASRQLVPLLRIQGEDGCGLPRFAGDGVVEVVVPQEPGGRRQRYRLEAEGLRMVREAQPGHELQLR
ncbi:MAG: hypothetical protein VW687_08760 [Curvibacter sp.]